MITVAKERNEILYEFEKIESVKKDRGQKNTETVY